MKFEESSLTGYLVKHLEPLTEADPTILSEYVLALLKKDKPIQELQKLCIDNLVEFLGHGTKTFVSELFKAFEDGMIIRPVEIFDDIRNSDPSPPITVEPVELKRSPPKEEDPSTSSRPVSDSEDKEVSDDEDDDRNHKHRRRDNRPQPSDEDAQEQFGRRSIRKKNKPYENGQLFGENDPQSVEIHKEYNPSSERDLTSNFEKRRPGLAPAPGTPADLGQRARVGRTFRTSNGPRFDTPTSLGRPSVGGGRGRGTAPWNQHDSRFNPLDTLGFAPQMTSQVPSLLGAGLSGAASAQHTSWGAYGFISGMSNGCLDPLHPLSLQGALHPSINTLNVGLPRQRCRDFEERGFCLRGDMCPMEHGINRIVVEDVQSLSQFNLPVSLPSTSILGTQASSVPLPPATSSNLLANSKSVPGKTTKSMVNDDALVSGVLSASAADGEADVYDPDQPLWNNDHPTASSACLRLPSPTIEVVEPTWEAGPSDRQGFRLSASMSNEQPSSLSVGNHGKQGTSSSVWGRIGSGNKFESTGKIDNVATATRYLGNRTKEEKEEAISDAHIQLTITEGSGAKLAKLADIDSGRKPAGRASQKAQRTLFVNGIPQKNNRKDALLSHFQKFGDVIDIYIPLNSEKAFVQFSKREEAEAALKAPDAVMGNRFIKLWWANRDNIADGEGRVHAAPVRSTTTLVRQQSSISDKGGESKMSTIPKAGSASAIDGPVPVIIPSKVSIVGGPKANPSVHSKVESLEVLREELRRKQESLAQKRNEFKRQLDKLEKQAFGTNKAEITTDQAVKKPKLDEGAEVKKASTPKPANANVGVHQLQEKALDKGSTGESIVSPNSRVSSTMTQQSPRGLKLTNYMPAMFTNRFKLDNRPTAFRIIPPLPADLANSTALKEHFSSFGDLVSVELEPLDKKFHGAASMPSPNFSAIITFATRHSAEKAFNTAKGWQGHSLQFVWLLSTTSSNSGHGAGEICANPTVERVPDAEVQPKPVISGLSSSSSETPNSTVNPEGGGDAARGECANIEQEDCGPEILTNDLVQISHSSPVSISCEERISKSDVPMVEDDISVGLAK